MVDLAAAKEHKYYSSPEKKRVEEDFKGQIVIQNVNGNVGVVIFCSTAAEILQDF